MNENENTQEAKDECKTETGEVKEECKNEDGSVKDECCKSEATPTPKAKKSCCN